MRINTSQAQNIQQIEKNEEKGNTSNRGLNWLDIGGV